MPKKLVLIENNQAITTSLKVAEVFEKEHKHVVRDIRELIQQMASTSQSSKLGSAQMFVETTYQAEEGGRRYPMFLLNRDGFSLLAMGFTGKKALQFKLKFINAFNRADEHGQNYAQAFRNARASATYIKRVFDGEVLHLH